MNDQGVKHWTQYTALWYTGDVMGLEILKTCGLFLRKSSILLHIHVFGPSAESFSSSVCEMIVLNMELNRILS